MRTCAACAHAHTPTRTPGSRFSSPPHTHAAGRSCAPCSTYQNAAVLSSAGEFKLDAVELWAVDDDVPEEEPQGTALDGVLGEQHAEARHFLELAGKKSHAAELAPLEPEQK